MGFFNRVHEIVKVIPEGRVMSYGDIAKVMGEPRKARFVGFAMKFCPTGHPWHRVVRSDGRVVTGNLQVMVLRKGVYPLSTTGMSTWRSAACIRLRPRCCFQARSSCRRIRTSGRR